jgi:hypothetical protein
MPGRTAKYYANNPDARKKRLDYQREYNKQDREVKKRVELNKVNRQRGTYGNGDNLDASHTKRGIVMKKASINRGSKTDTPGDRRARGGKK